MIRYNDSYTSSRDMLFATPVVKMQCCSKPVYVISADEAVYTIKKASELANQQ